MSAIEPRPGLLEEILLRIQAVKIRQLATRIGLAGLGLAVCLSYLVWNISGLWLDLRTSSFLNMLRLAISDPDVVLAHVQDLAVALLESAPIDALLLVAIIVFCVLATIMFASEFRKERRVSFLNHFTAN